MPSSFDRSVAPECSSTGAISPGAAPEYANTPPPSPARRSASTGRAERIGPTGSTSCEWKVTNRRVWPPSTSSSHTMSAWLSPDCGNAPSTLSIFTESAPRCGGPLGIGSPVNGYVGIGGTVVVVLGAALDDACAAGFFLSLLHATVQRRQGSTARTISFFRGLPP